MKNRIVVGACVLVVGLLIFSSIPTNFNTRAAPAVPHNAWGIAYDETAVAIPDAELISSWVDGVRYNFGDNLTFNGDGSFDVDTIGNNTLDETPGVKEGGYYGDQIMYLWGDGTVGGTGPNYIFEENATWNSAVSLNMDLNAVDMSMLTTFEWLVIDKLVAESISIPGIDYVQIWNPGASSINIMDYHFEKNDGNPVGNSLIYNITYASLMPNPDLFTISPTSSIYVNLTAIGIDLLLAGDELKLVWDNPGGPGLPFGSYDVVVDRVEYGDQDMEPDNTTMPDAPALTPGQQLERVGPHQDTNDCNIDFAVVGEVAWDPSIMPAQVVLTATHDPAAVTDVKLNWTNVPGAYGYMVYKDNYTPNNPHGVLIGEFSTEFFDLNGYLDNADYMYGVTSWGPGGENTLWDNNLGYKQRVTLNLYPAKGGDTNYLSLPYHMNITTGNDANGLMGHINTYGTGGTATSMDRWDPAAGAWDTSNFALTRGEAYRIIVDANVDYKVVGAHRNVSISLTYNGLDEGGVLNYISIPYHMIMPGPNFFNASVLLFHLNSVGGIPSDQFTRVARWDGSTGQWQSKTAIGYNFPLTAGEGYLVAIKGSVTYSFF